MKQLVAVALLLFATAAFGQSSGPETPTALTGDPAVPESDLAARVSPYARWSKGPPTDPSYFLLGMWLGHSGMVEFWADDDFGVLNTWVGVGAKEDRWAEWIGWVEFHGAYAMPQHSNDRLSGNPLSQATLDIMKASDSVIGWIEGFAQEPDNAYAAGGGVFDPCINPHTVNSSGDDALITRLEGVRAYDPDRPVAVMTSMGFVYSNWIGRGAECNKRDEDYPQYMRMADLNGTDIYPTTHLPSSHSQHDIFNDKVELLSEAMRRNRQFTPDKPFLQYIEASNVAGPTQPLPTYLQQRFMVWTSIIGGAKGIVWFCHKQPTLPNCAVEDLGNPDANCGDISFCFYNTTMKANIVALNAEVDDLAEIINSTPLEQHFNQDVQWARYYDSVNDKSYVFAANKSPTDTIGIAFPAGPTDTSITVINEARSLGLVAGQTVFQDSFAPYEVHLYEIDGDVGAAPVTCYDADFNNDMLVTPADFTNFIGCFSKTYPAGQ
jgi:hypothetical protein